MDWVYWGKLYESRFQANCLRVRMEQDWWIKGYESPDAVEVYKVKSGKYGVRYTWSSQLH
jgi:hypothetical protein